MLTRKLFLKQWKVFRADFSYVFLPLSPSYRVYMTQSTVPNWARCRQGTLILPVPFQFYEFPGQGPLSWFHDPLWLLQFSDLQNLRQGLLCKWFTWGQDASAEGRGQRQEEVSRREDSQERWLIIQQGELCDQRKPSGCMRFCVGRVWGVGDSSCTTEGCSSQGFSHPEWSQQWEHKRVAQECLFDGGTSLPSMWKSKPGVYHWRRCLGSVWWHQSGGPEK